MWPADSTTSWMRGFLSFKVQLIIKYLFGTAVVRCAIILAPHAETVFPQASFHKDMPYTLWHIRKLRVIFWKDHLV